MRLGTESYAFTRVSPVPIKMPSLRDCAVLLCPGIVSQRALRSCDILWIDNPIWYARAIFKNA